MTPIEWSVVAQADPAAVTVGAYWICAIVGGGLLALAAFGGSDADAGVDADVGLDMDAGVDADFDVDADVDAPDLGGDFHAGDVDAGADTDVAGELAHVGGHGGIGDVASWFSFRFVVFFVASFGLLGLVMTYLSPWTWGAVLAASLIGGLALGQGAHHTFRLIRKSSGDSTTSVEDYVKRPGRVTIPIVHPRKGQIVVNVRGTDRHLAAVARSEGASFARGELVGVIEYRHGMAVVLSRQEYEFLTGADLEKEVTGV